MQVDDQSIQMVLKQKPNNFQAAPISGGTVAPSCGPLQVDATCTILGVGSPPVPAKSPRQATWKLGFMQARILETNWAFYSGVQSSDGCVINDKVAKQPQGICRDYDRMLGHVFYEGGRNEADNYGVPNPAVTPPWNVILSFGDRPENDVDSSVINPKTGKRNYLVEGRLALGFVTTLTELAGPNVFVHHRHFMWTVVWHFKAAGGPAALGKGSYTLLPGSGFWISGFKRGAPTETKHRTVLDNPALTMSCNELLDRAISPMVQESDSSWTRFPLMDAPDKMF